MNAIPAYRKVVSSLHSLVDRRGWIPALDGGRLHVRSPHKALNTSLQSAGALVAKMWSCRIEEKLLDAGWRHGWDGDFAMVGFFHDEGQFGVKVPALATVKPYSNPTDYLAWVDEDEDALKKKIAKHRAKHLQDWYFQFPEIQRIANAAKTAIKEVEEHFEFMCPLDCEYKVGRNWADCH